MESPESERPLRPVAKLREVHNIIALALKNESEIAKYRRDEFAKICEQFERKYQMDSDTFLKRFENGELGDDLDFFDWFAAKRGLNIWQLVRR